MRLLPMLYPVHQVYKITALSKDDLNGHEGY